MATYTDLLAAVNTAQKAVDTDNKNITYLKTEITQQQQSADTKAKYIVDFWQTGDLTQLALANTDLTIASWHVDPAMNLVSQGKQLATDTAALKTANDALAAYLATPSGQADLAANESTWQKYGTVISWSLGGLALIVFIGILIWEIRKEGKKKKTES